MQVRQKLQKYSHLFLATFIFIAGCVLPAFIYASVSPDLSDPAIAAAINSAIKETGREQVALSSPQSQNLKVATSASSV